MMQRVYYLQAGDGQDASAQRYPINDLPCEVGRSPNCSLPLDFDRISRQHARFEDGPDGLLLVDLGSTNGTFVNHERIAAPTIVKAGDSIHFANHAFSLQYRQPSGSTQRWKPSERRQGAGETMIGFTAQPTGFPLQAPEFFEMLNDEQINGLKQPITTAGGMRHGFAMRGLSGHSRLDADSVKLFSLAEQLGEEVRLAEMIRRICIEQADRAGVHSSLFLEAHPIELEELDVLVDDLRNLGQRYHHLPLVLEVPLGVDSIEEALRSLRTQFGRFEIELSGYGAEHHVLPGIGSLGEYLDYVQLPASFGADAVAEAARALGRRTRIIVEAVDRAESIRVFSEAGAGLFRGSAIGPPEPIMKN